MILLAVSGGIDSMYLFSRAQVLFPGESFSAAHCNFSLRGQESDDDEAFVRKCCEEVGMECHTVRFDTLAEAASRGISVEMAARDLRYRWFGQLCTEHGFSGVAVAHNANDNAETLLLNLLRGTGSRGMRGMAAESPLPGFPGLKIFRPMLGTGRDEIREWMTSNGKSWREDSTNSEDAFKRNKLRNRVFPIFREINPSYIRTLCEDCERIAQVDDIAEDFYASFIASCDIEKGISVDALLQQRHWKYLLWRIVEPCALNRQTLDKLHELLQRYSDSPRGTVTLGGKQFEGQKGRVELKSTGGRKPVTFITIQEK